VENGTVRVVNAEGAAPTIPFWLGEAPARTLELSQEVSELRAGVERALAQRSDGDEAPERRAARWVEAEARVTSEISASLVSYLSAARSALGMLPTHSDILFERFFDDTGGMQLVVHSPHGGRVNRALGLLLRKRFCRSFDFELQAAASDDAIVLSLGPQHSFPLEDLRDFLSPSGVDNALTHAALVTPMFGVRWRWNLNRALVVLRYRGGRRNPPPIQRMEADDVTAAVFPSLAACQDNATGPREIPDHPLVAQTLHDCMNEAMDLPSLKALLNDVVAGQVRLHFRDTVEPSPLTHEILNARPYTFLDDAPLEERRTRAVQLRRGLPLEARDLSTLDPEAIARVRAEVEPAPRNADELHDLLLSILFMRRAERLRALFEELLQQGRALLVESQAGQFWCALECRGAVEAVLGYSQFCPDVTPPPRAQHLRSPEGYDREALVSHALRGRLDVRGPVTATELARELGILEGDVALGLSRLETEGFALRGHFEAGIACEQYCARRLLSRIHRATQERLRREVEPVTARDFMRFLLRWQGVVPDYRRSGQRGLSAVVEQLQGFELAVASWEGDVFRARLHDYRPEWLDALCFSGEVVWGRLALRATAGVGRSATVSRATPITLAFRADLPWLLEAARGGKQGIEEQALEPDCARLIECLRRRGALFAADLATALEVSKPELSTALWDGVARGLISSDGFGALRNLMGEGRVSSASVTTTSLRRGAGGAISRDGRWSLLPGVDEATEVDSLADAVAEQLLARWGVVFADLMARETFALPYREITWALRRLEARGKARGGRFVNGFVGEQYALPEAIDMLRAVRRADRTGETVELSACDPLNLTGIVLPGARLPAQRGRLVTLVDGAEPSAPLTP
jgi:ATP-dependent Lhr-like helicase